MIKEHAFLAELDALNKLIISFQKKATRTKKPSKKVLEQLNAYKAIQKKLEQKIHEQLEGIVFLQDDDWKTLLENAKLTAKIKTAITNILEADTSFLNPKEFVLMVEQFYVHRYTNHTKYLGQLNLGIDIDADKYQSYLETAVEYTLQEKGTATKATDLSAYLILLLKGRIKTDEVNNASATSQLIEATPLSGTKISLSLEGKKELEGLTKRFNSIPLIKKWDFGIDKTTLKYSIKGIGEYKENSTTEILNKDITDSFNVAMNLLLTEITGSLSKLNFGASVGAGDFSFTIDLGGLGPIEIGIKVATLSAATKDGLSFKPIEGFVKKEFSFEKHKKYFEKYEALANLVSLKIEFNLTISTSIGLKPDFDFSNQKDNKIAELIKEQEDIVAKKQKDYFEKQQSYNTLVEEQDKIKALQNDTKSLDKLIAKENDPVKKKKLLVERGKAKIAVFKKYQTIESVLKQQGVKDLGTLKKFVDQRSKEVKAALQLAEEKYDKLITKIEAPTTKLITELIQKQASKRMVSLLMKAVPVLNAISLAVDIYDAYTLVSDISAAYMQADTELEIDEELEAIIYANTNVNVANMPEIIPVFFYGIGAGGKVTELANKDVEELKAFFDEQFPKGDDSEEFLNFMFNYGDFYEVSKGAIKDSEELIKNIKKYKTDHQDNIISQDGRVVEFDEEKFKNPKTSDYFVKATYAIREGNPKAIGDKVKVDGSGIATNAKGETSQLNIPDDNLLELEVTKIRKDGNLELKTFIDFVLEQRIEVNEKEVRINYYRLIKGATFIYDVNKKSLTRKQ